MALEIKGKPGWKTAADIAKIEDKKEQAVAKEPLDKPVAILGSSYDEAEKKLKTGKKVISGSGGELAAILKQIQKDKGDKVVIKGSEQPDVPRLPTGIFEFDYATGGGFPRGRYSIVYGPESSGKTNLCYAAAAQAQQLPPPCNKVVWIDLEGTFDPLWAAEFGIDVDELILVKPGYAEEAVDLVDALIRAEDVALMVADSVAVMISTKELEQSAEKFDVGTSAILIKRMCNKLVLAMSEEAKRGHMPAVILVNQTRFKIGVLFGDPETMPGGQTLKFLSSLTVRLHGNNKIAKEINPELPAFKETSVIIKKAKVPVRRVKFDYDLCMLAHDGLGVGESDSWNKVKAMMQEYGILKKADKGSGWTLFGKSSPTLVMFQDTYQAEKSFAIKCQQAVIAASSEEKILVAAEGAAA